MPKSAKHVRFLETASLSTDSDISTIGDPCPDEASSVSCIDAPVVDQLDDFDVPLPLSQLVISASPVTIKSSSIDPDSTHVFTMQDLEVAFAWGADSTHQYYTTEISPYIYPREILHIDLLVDKDINIGDLHGNAMAMIHYLVKIGVLQFDEKQYQELVIAYLIISLNKVSSNPAEFNDAIVRFCELINSSIINKPSDASLQKPLIRFLGDMLCDRGANDFITLAILKKLHKEQCHFEIIWSNHDSLFLQEFYTHIVKPDDFGEHSHSLITDERFNDYYNSLLSMQEAMNNSLVTSVTMDKIKELVELYYLPHLNLATSVLRADRVLDVFTHAPICLSQIVNNVSVREIWQDNNINLLTVASDPNEFVKALGVLNNFFKQNIPKIVKAIKYLDSKNSIEQKDKDFSRNFKSKTGIELDLIVLIEGIFANQRYSNPRYQDILYRYYLANPESNILFAHRKFNGHDDNDEIPLTDSDNQNIRNAVKKLKTSISLNFNFGKAMTLSQSATFLVASRLSTTAKLCLLSARQVKPVEPITLISRVAAGINSY